MTHKKTKWDLLVIGELNIDLILNGIESFPELGKEKIAEDLTMTMGSSSAIFAANSSRLGLSVGFSGMVGYDDFGNQILEELRTFGIDTSTIITSQKVRTGLTAILRHQNDRAMVTYPGAMEKYQYGNIPSRVFGAARHLHISSLFLQPGIKKDLFTIIDRAKEHEMSVSIDPQWDPNEEWNLNFQKLVGAVDLFLPNEEEFLQITAASTLDEGITKLQPHLSTGAIIIKQGIRGATIVTSNNIQQVLGLENEDPVDTVGAGDSFNAGFVFQYLQDSRLTECAHFGNIAGAVSTTSAGGTEAIQDLETLKRIAKTKFSINEFAE